jgi:purine-nucleoside phosphorylase
VVSLPDIGVRNLARRLSAAEVSLLRQVLREGDGYEPGLVGYVCRGSRLTAHGGQDLVGPETVTGIVVVTDHANLTWRSPLIGSNDDAVGPRFPSMTGIYAPDMAAGRLRGAEGMIVGTGVAPAVTRGVVAGVADDSRLNVFEAQMAEEQGYAAVSSELVPVVIVAAHMGLRVAAAVVTRC